MTGHLSEAHLEALAHGREDLVPEPLQDHAAHCAQCATALRECIEDSAFLLQTLHPLQDVEPQLLQDLIQGALATSDPPPTRWLGAFGLSTIAAGTTLWTLGLPQGGMSTLSNWWHGSRVLALALLDTLARLPGGATGFVLLSSALLLALTLPFRRLWLLPTAAASCLVSGLTWGVVPAQACELVGTWPDPPPMVSLSVDQVPLSEALRALAELTDVGLSLQLNDNPRISLHVHDQPLPQVLTAALGDPSRICRWEAGMLSIRESAPTPSAPLTPPAAAPAQAPDSEAPTELKPVGERFTFGANAQLGEGERAEEVVTFGGNAIVSGWVDKDVFTTGGNTRVDGRVEGDVITVGGNVDVLGRVDGDVVTAGGNIHLGPNAELHGEVISMGGSVDAHPDAVMAHPPSDKHKLTASATWDDEDKASAHHHPKESWFDDVLSKLVRALSIFLFGLLLNALAPNRLRNVQYMVVGHPGRSLATGALTMIALPILTIALCVTLVGIPVAALLLVLAFTAVFVALSVIATVVGAALPIHSIHGRPLRELAAGTGLLFALSLLPYLGGLLMLAAVLLGYGALVQTRFQPLRTLSSTSQAT